MNIFFFVEIIQIDTLCHELANLDSCDELSIPRA